MSSNLKVNSLVPATGTAIGIGTTGGTIDFRCPATFGGNVTIGGTLTYDEVINIDSIGIVTARSGLKVTGGQLDVGSNIKAGNAGVITATSFSGSGANLTNLPAGQLTGTVADARISTLTASKLSGALPAISAANLTNIPAANITGTLPSISGANLTNLPAQATIANNADNRVITGGSGVNLNGEATLTFDGNNLKVKANTEGNSATLQLIADEGDDAADNWRIMSAASDNALVFSSSETTERLRIDSGGHVMIGTTTEGFATYGDQFTIANSGHCGMTIRSGTSSYGTIYFSDGADGSADEVRGFVDYNHANNMLQLGSNGSARIRIDSSGHMGLGVAPSAWATNGDFRGLQIGTGAALFGRGSGDEDRGGISCNYYHTGSAEKFIGNGHATRLYMADGSFYFDNTSSANASGANAALTLVERFRIDVNGKIRTNGATDTGHQGMVYIQGLSDPTASEQKSNLTVRGEGGNGFACGTYEATGNYGSWIQAGYVPNFLGSSPSAVYPLILNPNGAPVCVGNYNDASTNDGGVLRVQSQHGTNFYNDCTLSLEHYNHSNAREQKWHFISASNQGTEAKSNSKFRQHAVPYTTDSTFQTFTDQIVYAHTVGFNEYSWYKFNTRASSSPDRGGSARIAITWSTRHAAGTGYGEYSFAWRDEHNTSRVDCFLRKQHFMSYVGGTYYGWTSNPEVVVYSCTGGGSAAGFYLRLRGHGRHNSQTYDMGTIHNFHIIHNDNNAGGNNSFFEFVSNNSGGPNDASSVLSFN